jgi:hypothetical protein
MESTRHRIFSFFSLVFILLGVSGVNISGAAVKYTVPAAPTNVQAVGGVEKATLTWNAPYSNGGTKITAYKVTYYVGAKVHMCNSSTLRCVVDIPNPNKPSRNPQSVWYYFTVAAINSVGTGPVSIVGHARVLIKFRATLDFTNTFRVPTPPVKPTPTPTPPVKPTPTPAIVPTPTSLATGITAFDGAYAGQAVVSITTSASTLASVVAYPITFTVANGSGAGWASDWGISGRVTDAAGVAQVSVSNRLYGTFSFTLTFAQDPVTKVMSGNGKGIQTFSYSGIGDVKVEFLFNVSKGGTA